MQYSTNLNMNKPERADQYNLDHWNENTDILDSAIQNIKTLNDATLKTALLNFCYPVGSLYWSSQATDPATLFGGTWTQIKDKFVWAKGDSDTVNNTGGVKTVTLTTEQIPSHNHSFTPSGTVSNHSHTFTGTAVTSGGSSATNTGNTQPTFTGSAVTTGGMSGNENKSIIMRRFPDGSDILDSSTGTTKSSATGSSYKNVASASTSTASSYINWSNAHTHTVTASGTVQNHSHTMAHTHTVTASGTISSTQPTFTGTIGITENTGGGQAHDNMPPYIVKYCWERTA